jgi:hypothetical protein
MTARSSSSAASNTSGFNIWYASGPGGGCCWLLSLGRRLRRLDVRNPSRDHGIQRVREQVIYNLTGLAESLYEAERLVHEVTALAALGGSQAMSWPAEIDVFLAVGELAFTSRTSTADPPGNGCGPMRC